MSLSVRYTAGNKFSPVTVTGKRIFDLSVNARMLPGSTPHFFVTGTQSNIAEAFPSSSVQVLPAEQVHITVINPIFRMDPDKGPIPSDAEAEDLFGLFERAMMGQEAQAIISQAVDVKFDTFMFRERDVKLCGTSDGLDAMREGLAGVLRAVDRRFDFAEGMPGIFTTIARFGTGMSKTDYKSLRAIIERSASEIDEPINFHITPQNLAGVLFTGLFTPWVREFSLAGPSSL
ncbi:MAG: hypothetical protein WC527_07585 [Candidatus Margulisiibacteriota bacterium]